MYYSLLTLILYHICYLLSIDCIPIFSKIHDIGNLLVCEYELYAFAGGSGIKNLPQAVGLVGGFDCSD